MHLDGISLSQWESSDATIELASSLAQLQLEEL
jgi:hypothetical protein